MNLKKGQKQGRDENTKKTTPLRKYGGKEKEVAQPRRKIKKKQKYLFSINLCNFFLN